MLIRSLGISAVLLVGSLACASSRSSTSDLSAITEAGDRLWAAHERADAATMASLVTHDAVLMVPGVPDVTGRNAIRAAAEAMFGNTRIENFEVKKREIRVVGDEAYEVAWYSEVVKSSQGEPKTLEGRYVIVWKRDPSRGWLVHRNLFNFANATTM